jgi:hypothetical protein
MTHSLADVAFGIRVGDTGPWSLRNNLSLTFWDPVPGAGQPLSVRVLSDRFGPPGRALRRFAVGGPDLWAYLDRVTMTGEIRRRIRDPAVIAQHRTHLCGPMAILFELGRRSPVQFIEIAQSLMETGHYTSPTGWRMVADPDLRGRPVGVADVSQVDWLIAATMRDDMNITDDIDDGRGIEGITGWGAMKEWSRHLLILADARWFSSFSSEEDVAMRSAENALAREGTAFFLVDANLLENGGADSEEPIEWRSRDHRPATPLAFTGWTHSEDDDPPPDHWAVYLDGLAVRSDPDESDPVLFRVWSWGQEFEVRGTVDGFAEYLYGVVTATI